MVTLVVIRVKVMLSQFPLWLRFEFISFTNLKFRNVFFIFVSSVHNQRSIENSANVVIDRISISVSMLTVYSHDWILRCFMNEHVHLFIFCTAFTFFAAWTVGRDYILSEILYLSFQSSYINDRIACIVFCYTNVFFSSLRIIVYNHIHI